MGAGAIVIFHVRQQQATEVALAEHNNVVEAFPSDRTDQPFGISVLPWGTRRRRLIANAHRSKSSDENFTIRAIAIADQIVGKLLPSAGFRYLVCDPFRGRMRCSDNLIPTALRVADTASRSPPNPVAGSDRAPNG